MNLKEFASKVGDLAPILGKVLPLPGGEVIGEVIASIFKGDSTNLDDMWDKISLDPEAQAKLQQLTQEHERDLLALRIKQEANQLAHQTAVIESVNKTMQAESVSENWWQSGWRPFWGFTTGAAFFLQIIAVCVLVIWKPQQAVAVINALANTVMLWGIPGTILGVSAWHRGVEKRIRSGERRQVVKQSGIQKISDLGRRVFGRARVEPDLSDIPDIHLDGSAK